MWKMKDYAVLGACAAVAAVAANLVIAAARAAFSKYGEN